MKTLSRDDDFYPFGLSGRYYGHLAAMDKPHRHHEVELFCIEKGSCSRTLGGKSYHFSEGKVLLFWGAYPHQLLEPPDKCLIIYVPLCFFLNWEFESAFLKRILKGDLAVIPGSPETLEIVQLLKKRVLDGKIDNPSRATEREIQSQFLHLADFASEHPEAWNSKPDKSIFQRDHLSRIFAYLVENFQSPLGLAEFGKACHLHPNYLWEIFRQATGKTLNEYLTEYRLAYAKELLHRTDKKIVDVALESGFGCVSQFYAVFGKQNGISPTRFRQLSPCKTS